jgi:hypothetical protein
MRKSIAAGAALICMSSALQGQSRDAAPESSPRTLGSLLAAGYEVQQMTLAQGKMFFRKWSSTYAVTYICNRGAIASDTFQSYVAGDYDNVSCSLARDR